MGESFNIFDPKAHASKKPVKKEPSSSPKPAARPGPLPSDDELRHELLKIHSMHDDLNVKLGELHDRIGYSRDDFDAYFSNSANFTTEEWGKIQSEKDRVASQLGLGKAERTKLTKKHQGDKLSKERKGKMLGGRKRWLDMR